MKELMDREEFIMYAHEMLADDNLDCLYDTISEHNGAVAAYGDSWPGAMVRIQESISQVKAIERQLARLEKRAPRDFQFRVSSPR